jgi:hypothetical protein
MKTSKSKLHDYSINNEGTRIKIRTNTFPKVYIIMLFFGITVLSSCIFVPFREGGGHRGGGHEHHDERHDNGNRR